MAGYDLARDHQMRPARRLARRLRRSSSLLALTLALPAARPALAQTTQPPAPAAGAANTLPEVIVTAQKRAENLQDVPVAVTAVTAADAIRQGLTGTESLTAAVPSLVITNPANVGNPYLRGIGSALFDPSAEQSVAMYIDGVYIAAPESDIFSFNNISQVEVLKGPQGTLFGRNATGGVIQITTRDPTAAPHADLSAGYGNYGDFIGSAYVTGGLAQGLTADLAARFENQSDGYGRDLTTGAKTFQEAVDNYDLRAKLLYKPAVQTRIELSADYSHNVSTNAYQKPQGSISPFDGSTYPGPYDTLDDLNNRTTTDTGGGSIRVEQGLGPLRVTDIVAYRRTTDTYDLDDDVTALPIADVILSPVQHNWSEELQVAGPSTAWLKWIAGFYYFDNYAGYDPVVIDGATALKSHQIAVSYAGFGQATARILPNTDLTLGIRYTTEDQKFELTYPAVLRDSQKFDKITYRAALDYHFTPDISAYASYNTGFKSGGYNLQVPGNSFQPETLDAYEIGLKNELFDRRLRLNLDAFYYNDNNVQVLNSVLADTITSNAAKATIKGVEADFTALPAPHLTLSGGLALQTGRYDSYPDGVGLLPSGASIGPVDDTGKKTIVTPPVTGDITATYRFETGFGRIEPSLTAIYNSGFYWQADNRLRQPSYTLLNTSILWTVPGGRYDLRLWAKNLTDATYYIARLDSAGTGDVQEQAAPRTYGFTVSAHF